MITAREVSKPIIFSAPMVLALLDGSKTQTRRIVKIPYHAQIEDRDDGKPWPWMYNADVDDDHWFPCPYGQPGERLWVREHGWERPERTTKMMIEGADTWEPYYYDADICDHQEVDDFKEWGFKRRPSIHMPRWASRITLEITDVRVEMLQDISDADARAEGCKASPFPGPWWQGYRDIGDGSLIHQQSIGETPPDWMIDPKRMLDHSHLDLSAIDAYRALWMRINGPGSWALNPWVWAVAFKVVKP